MVGRLWRIGTWGRGAKRVSCRRVEVRDGCAGIGGSCEKITVGFHQDREFLACD